MSKSFCDKCGEAADDIDVGFSPGVHGMGHHCGGTWRVLTAAPPPGAVEWLRAIIADFVRETTTKLEAKPGRTGYISAVSICSFCGILGYRLGLTSEESDALLAVLTDATPKEFAEAVKRAQALDDEQAQQHELDTDSERRGDHLRDESQGPAPMSAPGFAMGFLTATPGVMEKVPAEVIAQWVRRHQSGDFGDLDAHDVAVNESAIRGGYRVLSAYEHEGVKVFVITEANRSRTTVLLRDEY